MKSKLTSNLNAEFRKFGIEALEADKILTVALRRGGELAELFFEETCSNRVLFENGRVDRVMRGVDRGVGLRILFHGRSVYGYTTDLTQDAIENLAMALSEAVPSVGELVSKSIPQWRNSHQPVLAISQYQIKKPPRDFPLTDKIDLVKRAEKAAKKLLPDARQVTAVLVDTFRKVLVINSDGLVSQDTKTYLQMMVQVVGAKNERMETAYASEGGYVGMEFFDEVTPESIAEKAAHRVQILLSAQPAPAGTMPVVISAEAGGTMIHEAVGHGLEADLACNGLSVYQGKLGSQVSSPLISVIDDGTMPEKGAVTLLMMKELHLKKRC